MFWQGYVTTSHFFILRLAAASLAATVLGDLVQSYQQGDYKVVEKKRRAAETYDYTTMGAAAYLTIGNAQHNVFSRKQCGTRISRAWREQQQPTAHPL